MAKVIVNASYAPSLIMFRGDLIRTMLDNGHQVTAIAPKLEGEERNTLEDWGVDCISAPLNSAGMNPISDFGYFWFLLSTFFRIKPDVLFSYTIKPVIYGGLASLLSPVKNVYALVSGLGYAFTGEMKGSKKLINLIVRLLYKMGLMRCGVTFFQNPDDLNVFLTQKLVKQAKTQIVDGSGVNLSKFTTTPVTSLPGEQLRFLFIGRLLKDKGIYEFADAAKQLKAKYPKLQFDVVGWIDGNPTAVTEQVLQQWIDDDIIVYHGRLNDVRPAIHDCSVFVLPSYREGTPRSVLEAMAIGRAVVTTDAPGCRETVTDGDNGFLVPVMDSDALAVAMEKFITDESLVDSMAERSVEIACNKYDVRIINRHMMSAMRLA